MEKIEADILAVEEQIKACTDPEERKMLRKKEEQLREKELILLRSNAVVAPPLPAGGLSPRSLYSCFVLSFNDLTNVTGTCSIVSKTLVLSAYHCVATNSKAPTRSHIRNWIISTAINRSGSGALTCETKCNEDGEPVTKDRPIPVAVYRYNIEFDWVLLRRTDGQQFHSSGILKIVPLDEIEQCVEEPLKIYHAPIDQFNGGYITVATVIPKEVRFGMRSKHSMYIEGGLFGGSSGGISIVASTNPLIRGKLLSMHQESVNCAMTFDEVINNAEDLSIDPNDAEEVITAGINSIANIHASMSHGLVIATQKNLMDIIKGDA